MMHVPKWWQGKDHPIWPIFHMAMAGVCALALSFVNSSHFDSGEIMTALGSVFASRLIFGARHSGGGSQ